MLRLFDYVEKAAFHWPDSLSVTFQGQSYTWQQTRERCRALAAKLYALGVRPGDCVAYLGLNSNQCFEGYFAPSLIGAAFVPINSRLSATEVAEVVEDCQPKVLIADRDHAETARKVVEQCACLTSLITIDEDNTLPGEIAYEAALLENLPQVDYAALGSGDNDTIIIFYTGGTTGKPKGVALSHINYFSNAVGTIPGYNFKMQENHLLSGPMFHAAAGSRVFSATILASHTVIMAKFDAEEMMRIIPEYSINVAQIVPTMVVMILDHPAFSSTGFRSLRMMTYGASPIPAALLERMLSEMPNCSFAQAFGMTEASPVLTLLSPQHHTLEGPHAGKLNSVGKPVPHVDVRVVDTDNNPVAAGVVGEIIARGPNMATEYLHNPEQTAIVFRDGWYHTGDSGYLDEDGFLFIVGRIKDMIISGGESIFPVEIENLLSKHPAVMESAIIGVPDAFWGESVHAIVVLKTDQTTTEAELIKYCRNQIAHYKCPRTVSFITGRLPMTSINKVDKVALRKQFPGAPK